MTSTSEKNERFQNVFVKKVLHLKQDPDFRADDRTFPRIKNYIGSEISSSVMDNMKINRKDDQGLPLILFHPAYCRVLLTTSGVYMDISSGRTEKISWSEMDFVAWSNLFEDDNTLTVRHDSKLMLDTAIKVGTETKTKIVSALMAVFLAYIPFSRAIYSMNEHWVIVQIFLLLLISLLIGVMSVILFAIIYAFVKAVLIKNFMKKFSSRGNVIRIIIGKKDINIGPFGELEDVVNCIKLALSIYRAQRIKYG